MGNEKCGLWWWPTWASIKISLGLRSTLAMATDKEYPLDRFARLYGDEVLQCVVSFAEHDCMRIKNVGTKERPHRLVPCDRPDAIAVSPTAHLEAVNPGVSRSNMKSYMRVRFPDDQDVPFDELPTLQELLDAAEGNDDTSSDDEEKLEDVQVGAKRPRDEDVHERPQKRQATKRSPFFVPNRVAPLYAPQLATLSSAISKLRAEPDAEVDVVTALRALIMLVFCFPIERVLVSMQDIPWRIENHEQNVRKLRLQGIQRIQSWVKSTAVSILEEEQREALQHRPDNEKNDFHFLMRVVPKLPLQQWALKLDTLPTSQYVTARIFLCELEHVLT